MKKLISVICAIAVIASLCCIGIVAEGSDSAAAGNDTCPVSFAMVIDPVAAGDTALSAKLTVTLPEDATGYELGQFFLHMNYDTSVMTLAKKPSWKIKGSTMQSKEVTDMPYNLLWASVNPVFAAGTTVAAEFSFDLAKAAAEGDVYAISLDIDNIDESSMPTSMASQDGTYTETVYTAAQIVLVSATFTVHTHSYVSVVTPPTKTEQGYTTHTCSGCGDSYVDSYVDPITATPGDVNDDGDVNLSDVTLLLKHLASWDVTINTDAADVNDDSEVTLADATLLLKHLAGWDVTLK